MTNATHMPPVTAHLPNEPDATHREGLANPSWPLCLEAEAVRLGFSAAEVAHGATEAEYELSEGGFWGVTCTECLEVMHA